MLIVACLFNLFDTFDRRKDKNDKLFLIYNHKNPSSCKGFLLVNSTQNYVVTNKFTILHKAENILIFYLFV